jgi:hypothetical protein
MRTEVQREHLLIGSVESRYDVAVGPPSFNAAFWYVMLPEYGKVTVQYVAEWDESQEDQTLLECDLMDTSYNLRHFIMHVMTRAQQLLHVATTRVAVERLCFV